MRCCCLKLPTCWSSVPATLAAPSRSPTPKPFRICTPLPPPPPRPPIGQEPLPTLPSKHAPNPTETPRPAAAAMPPGSQHGLLTVTPLFASGSLAGSITSFCSKATPLLSALLGWHTPPAPRQGGRGAGGLSLPVPRCHTSSGCSRRWLLSVLLEPASRLRGRTAPPPQRPVGSQVPETPCVPSCCPRARGGGRGGRPDVAALRNWCSGSDAWCEGPLAASCAPAGPQLAHRSSGFQPRPHELFQHSGQRGPRECSHAPWSPAPRRLRGQGACCPRGSSGVRGDGAELSKVGHEETPSQLLLVKAACVSHPGRGLRPPQAALCPVF